MCDFKPGDEVVCVGVDPDGLCKTVVGERYTISRLGWNGPACDDCGSSGVCDIEEHPLAPLGRAYCVCHFRKVQRRDLSSWLATATTFEGPRRLHPEPAVDALFRRIMAGDDR